MSKQNDRNAGDSPENTITFHYLKGNSFRVIHVDGALGGRTPQGCVTITTFSERPAIPRETTHNIQSDGTLSKEYQEVTRGGIVREMDVDLMMNLQVAKDIHKLIGDKIKEIESTPQAPLSKGKH